MYSINIEIKARTNQAKYIRKYLEEQGAECRGTDNQSDTYFNTVAGRLKLRQGNIENNLIYYKRENQAGPKQSDFRLIPVPDSDALKSVLTEAMGIKVVVNKKREIYYIGNVKFHLDELEGLGNFVEIEARNQPETLTVEELEAQCRFYMQAFKIQEEDLITVSYSDMLLGSEV